MCWTASSKTPPSREWRDSDLYRWPSQRAKHKKVNLKLAPVGILVKFSYFFRQRKTNITDWSDENTQRSPGGGLNPRSFQPVKAIKHLKILPRTSAAKVDCWELRKNSRGWNRLLRFLSSLCRWRGGGGCLIIRLNKHMCQKATRNLHHHLLLMIHSNWQLCQCFCQRRFCSENILSLFNEIGDKYRTRSNYNAMGGGAFSARAIAFLSNATTFLWRDGALGQNCTVNVTYEFTKKLFVFFYETHTRPSSPTSSCLFIIFSLLFLTNTHFHLTSNTRSPIRSPPLALSPLLALLSVICEMKIPVRVASLDAEAKRPGVLVSRQ